MAWRQRQRLVPGVGRLGDFVHTKENEGCIRAGFQSAVRVVDIDSAQPPNIFSPSARIAGQKFSVSSSPAVGIDRWCPWVLLRLTNSERKLKKVRCSFAIASGYLKSELRVLSSASKNPRMVTAAASNLIDQGAL